MMASVNQRLPSGPTVIAPGPLLGVGVGNSVIAWVLGSIIPILLVRLSHPVLVGWPGSVNQRLPSGPAVIPKGEPSVRGRGNSVIARVAGLMTPILPTWSVNQRLPSGPAVILAGALGNAG